MLAVLAPIHARVSLAVAALGALPEPAAEMVSGAFLNFHDDTNRHGASGTGIGVGPPQPALLTVHEVAADWARFAGPIELRAYLGAIWRALSPVDRQAFLVHIRGRDHG